MFHTTHAHVSTGGGISRRAALNMLGSVVYAARLDDGTIKIGCTTQLDDRLHYLRQYVGQNVTLLAFTRGDFDDEQAIHASLVTHRAFHADHPMAREYYLPTPEVLAVVNAMRDGLGLPHVA